MIGNRYFYIPAFGLAAICLASYFLVSQVFTQWLEDFVIQSMKNDVSVAVEVLTADQPEPTPTQFKAFLNQHNLISHRRRISIVNHQGKILADSQLSVDEVLKQANQSQLTEFLDAVSVGTGQSRRFNPVSRIEELHTVQKLSYGDFKGYIRITSPYSGISSVTAQLQRLISWTFVGITLFMVILGYAVQRQLENIRDKERARLGQHVQNRTREIELLHRLANMLTACNTLGEAQQVVEDIIPRILGHVNGAVSLMRASRNQLEVKLDWGGEWPGAKTFAPDECWALRKGKYHLSNDHYTTLPCAHMSAVGTEQTLCIPLVAHGNTIGMMHLYVHEEQFDDERMQLAFTIGEHLGLALANLTLQQELREQAVRDPLTGLHNRRYLEENITHQFMRAQRHKQPLSLLALDMDHFKRFNDTFGHDAGDYVLKTLGAQLVQSLRGEDIVCRVGGEELAVLLPNTDGEMAMRVAQKLCRMVSDLHLDFHGKSLGQLTLSIGVATFPDDGDNYEALMKQADMALYRAKKNGRNQALHCDPTRKGIDDSSSPTEGITLLKPAPETQC